MVYLICFDEHYQHARHYIGYVRSNLDARLERHKSGQGAKLLRAVNLAEIDYKVVRVWKDGDRNFERKLKNRKNAKRLCPVCNQKERGNDVSKQIS